MLRQHQTQLYSSVLQSHSSPMNYSFENSTPQTKLQPNLQSTTTIVPNDAPSRKMSVVFENTQEFNQDQLLRAAADVVGGNNIQYAARLSGGRFCLYLSCYSAVTTLCDRGGVEIDDIFLPCRKYVSDATKFLISNCPPEMSDDALLNLLKPYGKPVSTPTRLRVSTIHDDLKHVRTWTRSLYMQIPKDAPPCPEVMPITSTEGVKHTLYIETKTCNFCRSPSHTVEECNKKKQQNEDFPALEYIPSPALRLAKQATFQQPQTNPLNPHFSKEKPSPSPEEPPKHQDKVPLTSKPVCSAPEVVVAASAASQAVPTPLPSLVSVPQSAENRPVKRVLPPSPQVSSKVIKQSNSLSIETITSDKNYPKDYYKDFSNALSSMSFNDDILSEEQFLNLFHSSSNTSFNARLKRLNILELTTKLSELNNFATDERLKTRTKLVQKLCVIHSPS
ncbi:uncharacterized protein LOC113209420 isoform X1 [Frankliniella occidentalis]|uniref:Uncharacterized protein LOC113209420 isoform X1 n=1 Tax=Frankliniella occidentalis TaxID=133901 RepID=A0A6J1SW78_FRAOC|nr:uncharacterized protein LOC113209420 isoform X1 [Frankliniella occidentalis]XP_052125481.1 uncharacterized protein LOC113209420 isoform X1 [Frankliniella occidentalis]XP_052125482.1 uncharacterized protein LOC113209420 isoform X1 [Frankliniella occidentalis]XP_052125483.1 uncharacterized protein LOC113209420 isoform X1 [Frankliniella occidentalis]